MQPDYFATWLDRTLTEQDISGGEVSRAVGVNDSAVSRWRNGKGVPSLDKVRKLAAFLEVDPVRLMVTVGLMSPTEAGVERLPIPEDTQTLRRAKEHIMKMTYLDREAREALLKTLEQRYQE